MRMLLAYTTVDSPGDLFEGGGLVTKLVMKIESIAITVMRRTHAITDLAVEKSRELSGSIVI